MITYSAGAWWVGSHLWNYFLKSRNLDYVKWLVFENHQTCLQRFGIQTQGVEENVKIEVEHLKNFGKQENQDKQPSTRGLKKWVMKEPNGPSD